MNPIQPLNYSAHAIEDLKSQAALYQQVGARHSAYALSRMVEVLQQSGGHQQVIHVGQHSL
jgi:hypothetical protein